MKTVKQKIVMLSLGLLMSIGFAAHAMEEAVLVSKLRTEQEKVKENQTQPEVLSENLQKIVNDAIVFIKKGAATFPSSSTLNDAAKASEQWVKLYTDMLKNKTLNNQAYLNDSRDSLNKAYAAIEKTTYYNSDKKAARDVFAELKTLLDAVTTTMIGTGKNDLGSVLQLGKVSPSATPLKNAPRSIPELKQATIENKETMKEVLTPSLTESAQPAGNQVRVKALPSTPQKVREILPIVTESAQPAYNPVQVKALPSTPQQVREMLPIVTESAQPAYNPVQVKALPSIPAAPTQEQLKAQGAMVRPGPAAIPVAPPVPVADPKAPVPPAPTSVARPDKIVPQAQGQQAGRDALLQQIQARGLIDTGKGRMGSQVEKPVVQPEVRSLTSATPVVKLPGSLLSQIQQGTAALKKSGPPVAASKKEVTDFALTMLEQRATKEYEYSKSKNQKAIKEMSPDERQKYAEELNTYIKRKEKESEEE